MTIAVLGVGRVGSAIARAAIEAGYDVNVAASGSPADIALIAEIIIPGSRPMSAADAVRDAEIVVVAVPLHKFRTLDPDLFAGKVVVDVMNYWPPVDGTMPEMEDPTTTTSEVVAEHLAGARVVKTLNHIGYHEIEDDRAPAGSPRRRALVVASDDSDAASRVAAMLDRLGFDAIHSGPLATGRVLETGSDIFAGAFTLDTLREQLSRDLGAEAA